MCWQGRSGYLLYYCASAVLILVIEVVVHFGVVGRGSGR